MKGILLLLGFISFNLKVTAQHLQHPHRSHRPDHAHRVHIHSSAYKLSNRFFVKWTPTALIPISAASIRFGGEYCFAERYGVGLDAGYVIGGTDQSNEFTLHGGLGGFALNPEVRAYFGFRAKGRGFLGLQGLYRNQQFGPEATSIAVDGYSYRYSQSGATLNVLGIVAEAGFVARMVRNFHLEFATGIGVKNINWQRKDLIATNTNIKDANEFGNLSEASFLDHGTLPYIFIQLKLSWLAGQPVGGGDRHH